MIDKPEGEIPRPDVDGLSDVEAFNRELEAIENRLALIKNELLPKALADLSRRSVGDLRNDLIRYIYWNLDYVPKKTIAQTFMGKQTAVALHNVLAPPVAITTSCIRCGNETTQKFFGHDVSRVRQAPPNLENRLCSSCERVESDRRRSEDRAAYQARCDRELQMSQEEYEKSDYWRRLSEMLFEHAGFRCQICNAAGRELKIHARKDQVRGQEKKEDLLVLCAACYDGRYV